MPGRYDADSAKKFPKYRSGDNADDLGFELSQENAGVAAIGKRTVMRDLRSRVDPDVAIAALQPAPAKALILAEHSFLVL